VPEELGGTWCGVSRSVRGISGMLRLVGAVDPSVALVSAMHPAVLAFWLTAPAVEDEDWDRQRRAVLSTAKAGQRWGTLTSEPGTGGDILQTRAVAVAVEGCGPLPGKVYAVSGEKHFGSGMGITDWMVTTAVSEGESEPSMFVLDVRDRPWDGSAGLELLSEWDGAGMAATQSHAFRLDGVPATRYGLARPLSEIARHANPFILTLFTAVVVGVLDEAVSVARECLGRRADELRSYERVEWVRAEQQHWLAEQALEGSVGAVESGDERAAAHAALRAKQSVAELAESALGSLGRVLGGRSLSLASPFSRWSADVRALGYLRPPWALACDQLLETSW
jgi:alkylation response protein AidB-like acyl-CoA dehydrogenase